MASNFLISGNPPKRYGNAHANIVPYQSFQASDGLFALAVGNDKQLARLCDVIEKPEFAKDTRFVLNASRVENRIELINLLKPIFSARTVGEWLEKIEQAEIPCGLISNLDQTFSMPQVQAREMLIEMDHPTIGKLPLVGSPLKLSATPVDYKLPPPRLGEHTEEILNQALGFSKQQFANLKKRGIV